MSRRASASARSSGNTHGHNGSCKMHSKTDNELRTLLKIYNFMKYYCEMKNCIEVVVLNNAINTFDLSILMSCFSSKQTTVFAEVDN